MTVVEVLKAARKRVAHAWAQGDDATGNVPIGKYCMSTALDGFASTDERDTARYLLREVIGAKLIVYWNDQPGRTQADVLAAFDRAITLAEAAP